MTADLVDALTGFTGITIRVRHELPPASMRLMDTLGATVLIDETAPECVRFTSPHERELRTGGCRECKKLAA